jgi:RNA polymerase primary sigma factor
LKGVSSERGNLEQALAHRSAFADALAAQLDGDPRTVAETQDQSDAMADLCRRAQAGDTRAREELIDRLLPLVNAHTRRYRTEGLDPRDLLQDGIVGLLRALERYDPSRDVPFAGFASFWVRQALQEARADFMRPFRLPPKALRQLSQLKSEHQRIYQTEHRSASIAELAEKTQINLDQAQALIAADNRVHSLNQPIETHGGEIGTLGDLLEDPMSPQVYEEIIDTIAGEQLRALLSNLTARERGIVRARFGFDGEAEPLLDIGQRLGISAERVRQIEEHALAKLRHVTQ